MQNLNNKINNFFSNIDALATLIFRFGIGIAFIIHGLGKFPLPPQGLIEYFDLSPSLASLVALSELSAGILLSLTGWKMMNLFCLPLLILTTYMTFRADSLSNK